MQWADCQRIGAAFTGHADQILQRLGVTEAAVAGAAQRIQLRTQTPNTRNRIIHRIADTEATLRRHGQGEVLIADVHLLIADRNQSRQYRFRVQFQVQPRAVFKVDFARGLRGEIPTQIEADADIAGQQRRQVPVLLGSLQFQQAGVDFLRGAGGVAESDQNIAQHRRGDFLRAAVGVDPVDGKAGAACKYFQLRIAHRRSPSRGCKGVAAVRLTSAQYAGSSPDSDRSTLDGC
ncbi:hypothetical protein D3C72_569220 [compost metagenome]